jgi:hypothetical protein
MEKDNPDWERDWSDPSTCPVLEKLEKFMTNLVKSLILDGMMFFTKHQKHLDQRKTNLI